MVYVPISSSTKRRITLSNLHKFYYSLAALYPFLHCLPPCMLQPLHWRITTNTNAFNFLFIVIVWNKKLSQTTTVFVFLIVEIMEHKTQRTNAFYHFDNTHCYAKSWVNLELWEKLWNRSYSSFTMEDRNLLYFDRWRVTKAESESFFVAVK